jgi:hypothetical protein
MFKLGTMVKDTVTGLEGMLTHLHVEGEGGHVLYNFQPRGLNPKTQEPVDDMWIAPNRIKGATEVPESPQLSEAMKALNTEVEDQASGFKGIAVAAILHINGCVHLDVQPPGVVAETGKAIKRNDFDIRRLKGKAIKPLTEAQYEKSVAASPSPAPFTPPRVGS